jgi:hypothetical protein
LTQLVNIPSKVKAVAQFMAEGGGGIGSQAFAVSILLYFSSLGFFAGYVLTRMFFQVAFVRADSKLSQGDVRTLQNAGRSLDPKDPPDANALGIAEKTRAILISESLTADVAGAVATGAILMGDTPRAVQAAKIAVEKNPGEARAHLNYAIALYRSDPSSDIVKIELEKAHGIVTRNADAAITEDICNSIVYFYLYVLPPEGFTKAIEYGEDYLKNNTPSRASIWINLACAYAQQYAYMQSSDSTSDPKQLEPVKNKAFQAVQNALSMSPKTAARFRQLATGRPDPEDDDLKVFASDEQFRRMIGLD